MFTKFAVFGKTLNLNNIVILRNMNYI